ncbi:MAG: site-specific integrase [Acetobacteraceae bacterium]|nr:site-specific integrase [Acetobacteraceae bacterium]
MPRTVADTPLTTRAARERLAARHQPYWRGIEAGAALGYRKGRTGGVWLVRIADPTAGGGYRQHVLGRADDVLTAAGEAVLDFRQAEKAARDEIARRHRVAAGQEPEPETKPAAPFTVSDAIATYLADYVARGGKALSTTKHVADAHILPPLGAIPVGRLTRDKLKGWHRSLAATPARVRSRTGETRHRVTGDDPDAARRRASSANRVLTVLKAALNHAHTEGKVSCHTDAWAAVKPFREADKAKVRYLHDDEITRLVNVCAPDFRALVTGALMTGARYGELAAMRASDFDVKAATVTIPLSKSGKPRHIALTDEGRTFFRGIAAGTAGGARLFERDRVEAQATRDTAAKVERAPWGDSDQFRPIRAACDAANISPPISFHELRHTYASRLAQRGVPMGVIAAQLGHADTRMTEKHYAHLSPNYIAETVRQAFGHLGIVPESNVTPIRA